VADHYVAAVPVERMAWLADEAVKEAEPSLANLDRLHTEWMNGIQFFVDREMPLVNGHLALVDSPWAVTAIAQKQFWPHTNLAHFGDGRTRDVLSAIVANWDTPGLFIRKPARECSRRARCGTWTSRACSSRCRRWIGCGCSAASRTCWLARSGRREPVPTHLRRGRHRRWTRRTSSFRGSWPVNKARQGFDLHDQEPLPGLLMVGDAYKPTGHIMAEGVAAGVQRVATRLPDSF
jgi:hypothetical protein